MSCGIIIHEKTVQNVCFDELLISAFCEEKGQIEDATCVTVDAFEDSANSERKNFLTTWERRHHILSALGIFRMTPSCPLTSLFRRTL